MKLAKHKIALSKVFGGSANSEKNVKQVHMYLILMMQIHQAKEKVKKLPLLFPVHFPYLF